MDELDELFEKLRKPSFAELARNIRYHCGYLLWSNENVYVFKRADVSWAPGAREIIIKNGWTEEEVFNCIYPKPNKDKNEY